MKSAKFGVAGYPPNFFLHKKNRNREEIFHWLNEQGLDWIELQNTYGVKMRDEQAQIYKQLAEYEGIGISLHGPYYITLASGDKDVVRRSKERIMQCFHLAEEIGAKRIIFHPGYYPGQTKEDRIAGVKRIISELKQIKDDVPSGLYLYPETAGKCTQIGSLEEIIQICEEIDFAWPCIDLAHIHGFTGGTLCTTESIVNVFDRIEKRLGKNNLEECHVHMYPVEFDGKGEKKHRAFDDLNENPQLSLFSDTNISERFYPRAEHFVEAIKEKNIAPVVVCEAHDSQDIGARLMKDLYFKVCIETVNQR